jgi:hypothetical protein
VNKKELQIEREKGYKTWFERWYKRAEVESQIKINNSKGYTGLIFKFSRKYDSDIFQRVNDDMFIDCLKEKLPEFEITIKSYEKKSQITNLVFDRGIKVTISWGYIRIESAEE